MNFVTRISTLDEFHSQLQERMGDSATLENAKEFADWIEKSCDIELSDGQGQWIAMWETLSNDDWNKLLSDFVTD